MFLSIDPGLVNLGWSIFNKDELVRYGFVCTKKKVHPHKHIVEELKLLIPDIQHIYFEYGVGGVPNNSLYEVIGLIKSLGIPFTSLHPKTVKKHICHSGVATKEDIFKVISRQYKVDTKNNHVIDSIAIGVTGWTISPYIS